MALAVAAVMLLAVLAPAGPAWAQDSCPPDNPACETPPPPPPPGSGGNGGGGDQSFQSQSSSQGESQSHSVVSGTGGGGASFGFPPFYAFPFGYYYPVF